MAVKSPLAHSPREGVPAQTYHEHITNVRQAAVSNARCAVKFYNGNDKIFVDWVDAAALDHDLGKLDKANQEVLKTRSKRPLPLHHQDAGVADLWKRNCRDSAVLVAAHHSGLFSKEAELPPNKERFLRDEKVLDWLGDQRTDRYVDERLLSYLKLHERSGLPLNDNREKEPLHQCGFTRRLALSCLVDADHGDTARNYGAEVETAGVEPRWEERLVALQQYVDGLPEGQSGREKQRNLLRKRMFAACRDAPHGPSIRTCDAPVGSGKTTAVMAHLLRVAAESRPQLRHIIVVLPYTNIIKQSVDIYRKALVLDGERADEVIAEHHHKADFDNLEARQFATLWKAPIIVTTAVQFFETLGSHQPARLRKLHELPGSAVFVDEMHAAIPAYLWPQTWRWLETLTNDWGGHLILASGSLARFWELAEYNALIRSDNLNALPRVPDLVTNNTLRDELGKCEKRRIRYRRRPEHAIALDCQGLVEFVIQKKGPRLLIVNTVQTAAVVAHAMRQTGHDVLHLSTALAPVHRDAIVEKVKSRLKGKRKDWTLVATSCVEAGMNFSFRTGIRERASTASLIQIGGRVSRDDEFDNAETWDILLRDDLFRHNPTIKISCSAVDTFTEDDLNNLHPSKLATEAMRREWTAGADSKARCLIDFEKNMEYPSVSEECRVINVDTRTVIIDRNIVDALRNRERVPKQEIMKNSVQLWAYKIDKLALPAVFDHGQSSDADLFAWCYDYDPDFLGYMKGILKLDDFIAAGGAII